MARREADPAWKLFQYALTERPSVLAERLGVDPVTISAWKAGRQRPRFEQLPDISRAIANGDSTYLARKMRIIPDDELLIRDLQALTDRIRELRQQELESWSRKNSLIDNAIGDLVAAVSQSQSWAIAVWPTIEGPTDCRIHTADRLDFRRVDGSPISYETTRAAFGEYLDRAGAVKGSKRPRWSASSESESVPAVGMWSIPRFTLPFPAAQWSTTHPAQSIAVVSTSISAHPTDVSTIMAYILGYGCTSTRWLVMSSLGGGDVDDQKRDMRFRFHNRMLQNPREHQVWNHFGRPTPGRVMFPGAPRDQLAVVWLRESDKLLAGKARSTERVDTLKRSRDEIDAIYTREASDQFVRIDVDVPPYFEGCVRGDLEIKRSLDVAISAIIVLRERNLLDAYQLLDNLESTKNSKGASGTIANYVHPHLV